ncbi:hypothetical protein [Patulibacter defluvii]|uniref:hypothetical protein n=1 Tax=Patulibacter defluvii TaxID=3095358 RepID=UPI002A756A9E|nr:hypothetical protein [Patulibacter sp. DM4]
MRTLLALVARATAVAVAVGVLLPGASTAAPGPPGGGVRPGEIRALADQLTATALATIDADGRPRDPLGGNHIGYYGPAAFGYAGLRAAVRRGDRELLDRALHALRLSADRRHATPFDQWLVAKAYAWGSARLADDPAWRATAPALAGYLDDPPLTAPDQRPSPAWIDPGRYNNWKLVELAARAIAQRAGRFPATPARRRRQATIERLVARAAAPAARGRWTAGSARALSDPPSNPLAYSALSAVMLRDVGRAAPAGGPPALRRLRAAVGRYLLAMAAPDGTVAWSGRSAELSWTLAAAMVVGADRRDGAGRGLTHAAWRRLLRAHGVRPDGYLAIAPVLRIGDDASGIDRYANTVIYGGLTVALLNDAADALDGQPALRGGPPSATGEGETDDRRGSGAVTGRRGDVWWAATLRPSHLDLRYQPGLQAVQVRDRGGRWHALLPARPKTGPARGLWPTPDGCRWRAIGATALRCRGARLTIAVDRRRRRLLLRLRTRPGAVVRGRLYLPAPRTADRHSLAWPSGRLRASGPLTVRLAPEPPRSSPTDRDLQAVDYAVRSDRRGRLQIALGR